VKVLGQAPVKLDGEVLAITLVTANGIGKGSGAELTVVTADLVMVPAELVALIVNTVDVVGDTTLVPATLTCPIPWSILTDVAPVTAQNKIDVSPASIVDGLLLNSMITGGVPTDGTVKQPGMRNSNNNSDRERKTNLFNVVTSKNMLPATSTRP
jgi:hypothetical protein